MKMGSILLRVKYIVKAIAKYISKKDNDHNGAIRAIKDVLKKLSK
jgi:hypothetical protein